jgi:hypothetical protein
MFDELRYTLFWAALALILTMWFLELGGTTFLVPLLNQWVPRFAGSGFGITALANLDAFLMLTIGLMGISLILPEELHGRLQGFATLIVTLIVMVTAFMILLKVIVELIIMVTLLPSWPFGTAAYMAVYSHFPRSNTQNALACIMMLKFVAIGFLVAAHQRYLQQKGLVILFAVSLVATLLVNFLLGLVPGVVVSITDAIGAIIVCMIAIVYAIVFLVQSSRSIIRAIA